MGMDEMSADEARRNWRELLECAHFRGEHVGITRNGQPWVVVVSREWHDSDPRLADLSGYEANHKDGDPYNNDPANLEIREAAKGKQA